MEATGGSGADRLVASRGGAPLTLDDLRIHLASVLRLENVGVLLGAGASVSAGGRTVAGVWGQFLRAHESLAEHLGNERFISEDSLAVDEWGRPTSVPDVEQLLDSLEIAKIEAERKAGQAGSDGLLAECLDSLLRTVIGSALLSQERWADPSARSPDLAPHRTLLQRIVGARQPGQPGPWLFTTNYDLAVEWAAEEVGVHVHTGFVGIHGRGFSPQSFDLGLHNAAARGEARFGSNQIYLAKLHGSLSWERKDDFDYRELAASEMWPRIEKLLNGGTLAEDFPLVFPRAAKYRQTVGYISGELFRRFSDFLSRAQTVVLITGYSFGDEHLNRLIWSALLNPTLQLVVFLPELLDVKSQDSWEELRPMTRRLLALELPRVTFVGGGSSTYFDQVAQLLPEPAVYDLSLREMKDLLDGGQESEPSEE